MPVLALHWWKCRDGLPYGVYDATIKKEGEEEGKKREKEKNS